MLENYPNQSSETKKEDFDTQNETARGARIALLQQLKLGEEQPASLESEEGLAEELKQKMDNILTELPDPAKKSIYERALSFQEKGLSDEGILEYASEAKADKMLAYKDNRDYVEMHNRRFVDLKLFDAINHLVEEETTERKDLATVARLTFDMNGLKALNDLGGHSAGNEALALFSHVLKAGETTTWLKETYGMEVVSSMEGGDEFGIIISSGGDLRQEVGEEKEELASLVQKKYAEEIRNIDASHLLDFSSEKIIQTLSQEGITIPEDFKFEISTSVGMTTLDEALPQVEIVGDMDYKEVVKKAMNEMFKTADMKAIAHKEEFKGEVLPRENPELASIYKLGREDAGMNQKMQEQETHIKELEAKLAARG